MGGQDAAAKRIMPKNFSLSRVSENRGFLWFYAGFRGLCAGCQNTSVKILKKRLDVWMRICSNTTISLGAVEKTHKGEAKLYCFCCFAMCSLSSEMGWRKLKDRDVFVGVFRRVVFCRGARLAGLSLS
jgi:hypothetical protein